MSSFLSSLRDYLKTYFGVHWRRALVGLVLIVYWPIAVFGHSLSFDAAAFTTEWIKMGTSGILLFLFVQLLAYKRESRVQVRGANTYLVQYYLAPLSSLRVALAEFEAKLVSMHDKNAHVVGIPDMITFWRSFETNLELVQGAPGIDSAASILAIVHQVNLARTRNIIQTLQNLRAPADFNRAEYNDAVTSIDKLLSDLANLRKVWERRAGIDHQ